MNLNLLLPIVVPAIAIFGFVFLSKVLLEAWNSRTDRRGGPHGDLFKSLDPKRPLPHSDCYDACMSEAHWEYQRIPACVSSCGL